MKFCKKSNWSLGKRLNDILQIQVQKFGLDQNDPDRFSVMKSLRYRITYFLSGVVLVTILVTSSVDGIIIAKINGSF